MCCEPGSFYNCENGSRADALAGVMGEKGVLCPLIRTAACFGRGRCT